jgi:hypothetical protein
MPPALITRKGSGGICVMGRVPPSPTGIELAKAAVAAAADSSRPEMTAVSIVPADPGVRQPAQWPSSDEVAGEKAVWS